jgi:hypothetical protein
MRIIGISVDELATARERELADKVMQDPNFEELVDRHMECHNRFKSIALLDLEPNIQDMSTQLEQLGDEIDNFDDTWNTKWDTRHGKVVLRILEQMAD